MLSDRCLQFVIKKKFMVKILDIVRIFAKSGDREVVAQIGRVGMFVENFANDIHVCLRCYGAHLEQILERQRLKIVQSLFVKRSLSSIDILLFAVTWLLLLKLLWVVFFSVTLYIISITI